LADALFGRRGARDPAETLGRLFPTPDGRKRAGVIGGDCGREVQLLTAILTI
jgi:hypothetical protein